MSKKAVIDFTRFVNADKDYVVKEHSIVDADEIRSTTCVKFQVLFASTVEEIRVLEDYLRGSQTFVYVDVLGYSSASRDMLIPLGSFNKRCQTQLRARTWILLHTGECF